MKHDEKRATWIRQNIQKTHEGTEASRYGQEGLSSNKVKLSSKNFDRLMQQRGLDAESSRALKRSMYQDSMQVRHAKAVEKFVTTHGTENSSGVFVSEKSLGKTAGERIQKGALYNTNSAEYETQVELAKDQNLLYGTIRPQRKFEMLDPEQRPRPGGEQQVVTVGGYKSGAIINRDSKYPAVQGAKPGQGSQKHKKGQSR